MPSNLNLMQERLSEIHSDWNNLGDEAKKQKINFILPMMQMVSVVWVMQGIKGNQEKVEGCGAMLDSFQGEFRRLYGHDHDIGTVGNTDIPAGLFQQIEEVQKNGEKASEELISQLLDYDKKYTIAQSKMMFNYGRILNEIFEESVEQKKREIYDMVQHVDNLEDTSDLAKEMRQIHSKFEVEKSSTKMSGGEIRGEGKLHIDSIENHALLCQMSSNGQNISKISKVLMNNQLFEEAKQTMGKIGQKPVKYALKNSKEDSQQETKETRDGSVTNDLSGFSDLLETKGLSMQVGFETEYLLGSLDSYWPSSANDRIKTALGDLNGRRKMELKYGFTPTIPAITDMTLFLSENQEEQKKVEEEEVKESRLNGVLKSGKKFDLALIKRDINGFIDRSDWEAVRDQIGTNSSRAIASKEDASKEDLKEFFSKRVDEFTVAEIDFYKTLFLNHDPETSLKIEMEGVFDPKKSKDENIMTIIPFIGSGMFHEKTLDAIRAHEISVGPFEIGNAVENLDKTIEAIRLSANQSGSSINNPNVQLNHSLWVDVDGEKRNAFFPEIRTDENGDKIIKISRLGADFVLLISQSFAEMTGQPGILRGQTEILASLDLKKGIGEDLEGSEYLEHDPNINFYSNHREKTGKAGTIRVAVCSKTNEVAVVEGRLVGNNPHFAIFDESETLFESSVEFVPGKILQKIAKKAEDYLDGKDKDEVRRLYEEKVIINTKGRIEGYDPVPVNEKIEEINPYDLSDKKKYDPLENLRKGGVKDDISLDTKPRSSVVEVRQRGVTTLKTLSEAHEI